MSDSNPNNFGEQNDPFSEGFFLLPPEEQVRVRAHELRNDNRDAVRHYVELLSWEIRDNPELLKVFIGLIWNWATVDLKWIAEATFMNVNDVRRIAQSQSLMAFLCLDCGVHLQVNNQHRNRVISDSVEDICENGAESQFLANVLCKSCSKLRDDYAEEQRQLDDLRHQELLKEYRRRPYRDRRKTQEWTVLKRQIHRRDGYRCRLCGQDDRQLHVHHRTYATYAEERLEDLVTLCSSCHRHFHFLSEVS